MNWTERVAVVTGGNRGIGLEVCRQLADLGVRTVLTSREEDAGEAAAGRLSREGCEVWFHPLDVRAAESVAALQAYVLRNWERLDILVNNAGVMLDRRDPESGLACSALTVDIALLRQSMDTNVYGALRLCQAFAPMMRDQGWGRIVNVSSGMGQLSDMNGGWPGYRISKTGLNAVTRILADELSGTGVKVNSACPGWVRTDMGGQSAPRSVEEGADTIVWLATLSDDGPTGGFFRDRRSIAW